MNRKKTPPEFAAGHEIQQYLEVKSLAIDTAVTVPAVRIVVA